MRCRWGIVIGAIAAAAAAHLVAARIVRGTPLLGAGGFAREMAAIVEGPGTEDDAGVFPLRVSLGAAEHATARAPGPRAVLDPGPLRRPPEAGADWLGLPGPTRRLAACAAEMSAEPGEGREPPRVAPPGFGAPFMTDAGTPSPVDRAVARDVFALDVRAATRPLPARFRAGDRPSLARAAGLERPSLDAGGADGGGGVDDVRLDFSFGYAPSQPPPEWPAPEGGIAAPDIFVDVTADDE